MNFPRTQTSIPRLSEQGITVSNVSRKARALRRRGQVQGCGPEFLGRAGRDGAEREFRCASHRRSLHEMLCTRTPRHSVGIAQVLPGEGYSGASHGRALFRVKVAKRSTFVRPVNPSFHRKIRRSSCTVFRAIRVRLVLRRPLSQQRMKKYLHDHVWDIPSHPYVHRETCPRAAL